RRPGIASSLSAVPPVWPSARPVSITTGRPQAASSGASGSDTLSPTPTVECLSQSRGTSRRTSHCSPELRVAPRAVGVARDDGGDLIRREPLTSSRLLDHSPEATEDLVRDHDRRLAT